MLPKQKQLWLIFQSWVGYIASTHSQATTVLSTVLGKRKVVVAVLQLLLLLLAENPKKISVKGEQSRNT